MGLSGAWAAFRSMPDEPATLFAQGCHRRGTAKLTLAGACLPVLNTGEEATEPPPDALSTTACGHCGNGARASPT